MAEVLAAGTRLAGIFASGCTCVVAPGAALQRACGIDSSSTSVSEDSRSQVRAVRSSARLAALCGIIAHAGAARPVAHGNANSLGICRSDEFSAVGSGRAGVYADLCACALWRRAVQYNSPRAIARTSASGAPLKTKDILLSSDSIQTKMQPGGSLCNSSCMLES